MKKLVYYIQIVDWMKKMSRQGELFSSQLTYGNIAFFVDGYAECAEFPKFAAKIKELSEGDDLNELCWQMNLWISHLLEEKAASSGRSKEKILDYLDFQMDIQAEEYNNKECDDFWLADEAYYPEWFWEYYSIQNT